MNRSLLSSKNNEWETPHEFYKKLNEEFKFNLDPCSTNENAKCANHFTKKDDGLSKDWGGCTAFVNPPYGREISKWVKKAWEESLKPNTTIVLLIPARTDTSYWHDYIFGKAKDIRFIRGRLKFVGATENAPFPNAIIVFSK